MRKVIPGNSNYFINLAGEIFDANGELISLKVDVSGFIQIEMYGNIQNIKLDKLALLAWYECGIINNLNEHLDKIEFHKVDNSYLRLNCGKIMTFKEPIYFKSGFRYVPNFPRYAISKEGVIIDTFSNKEHPVNRPRPSGYVHRSMYDPDTGRARDVRTHRILAYTWLSNDDIYNRTLINHKDGIRSNNDLSNLEWCTSQENMRHATDSGLLTKVEPVKVRNVDTGKVTNFKSFETMREKFPVITVRNICDLNNKLPGHLWGGQYEVKLHLDNTPWYYEEHDVKDFNRGKSIFTITVKNKESNVVKTYNNVKMFAEAYGVIYKDITLKTIARRVQETFPTLQVTYTRNDLKGPYYVWDNVKRELHAFASLRELSLFTNIPQSSLRKDISLRRKYIYDQRWYIINSTSVKGLNEYVHKKPVGIRLEVTNCSTNEIVIATSIKHAVRLTGLDEKTVRSNIGNTKVKNWLFRAL